MPYWLRAFACCLVFTILAYEGRKFQLDDALIYARYIRNALEGRGLVYNPGEAVNALTSPLDTWLQLGSSWLLGGRILLAQQLLGSSVLLVTFLIAESIVPFAGLVLSTCGLFYYCLGMETSVFLLLLVSTVWAYEREKIALLPTLCVLCFLARFEGGALVLFVAVRLWQRRRFPPLVAYVIPIGIAAFYLAFNFHFFHHLLPQSASAKFGQGRSGFWGRWPTAFLRASPVVYRPFGTAWTYMPVLTMLAAYGSRGREFMVKNRVLVPFLILLAVFYVGFNIPSYYWYYAPFVYFLTIYAASLLPQTRTAIACLLFVLLLTARCSFLDLKDAAKDASVSSYSAAGEWLSQHASRNATVASVETGTVGWTCNCYLYDIVGLTTPKNAEYTAKRDFSSWILTKPDYVVLHPDGRFPWDRVAIASPEYELLPIAFGDVGIMKRKSYKGL